MSYRNILVHVDSSAGANARIAAAAELASRFKCALTGAFVYTSKLPVYMVADGVTPMTQRILDDMLSEQVKAIGAASSAARDVFSANLGRDKIASRWLGIDAESDGQFVDTIKRHDLVILPPEIQPCFSNSVISAARVGMASGGPVVVLKQSGYPVPFGKKILIAWNDSREAMRAIRDAWPFLEIAEEIHFVSVSADAPSELDVVMMRLFQDHGCPTPQYHVDRSDAANIEDIIRLHAGRTGADLIVLGLYGHSRLRELVVGGVSRGLLANPSLPLLMSH